MIKPIRRPKFADFAPSIARSGIAIMMMMISINQAHAENSSIIAQVKEKYGNITTASANFDLSIYWSVREKTESMRGTMAFAPGGKFRIDLPSANYVCDGKKLWQYNHAAKQVIIDRAGDLDEKSFPSAIIAGCFSYSFSEKAQSRGQTELEANLEGKNINYDAISIFVDSRTCQLEKIATTDRSGNTSTYLLKSFAVGGKAKLPSFTFEIPKGSNVIDKTE